MCASLPRTEKPKNQRPSGGAGLEDAKAFSPPAFSSPKALDFVCFVCLVTFFYGLYHSVTHGKSAPFFPPPFISKGDFC